MSMGRTSLFVGDLAIFCTEVEIERLFSQYGQILEIKIMRSEETYRNLSYGFIKFALFECARQAMLELDGVLLCGRPMRVRWATFKNKLNPKDMRTDGMETSPVHISFISYQISRLVTEQTLRALYGRFGEVVDVSIKKSMIDKDIDRQSGYGFVHYSIEPEGVQSAVMAAQYLHDTTIDDVNYKSSISHNLNRFLVEDMGIPQSTLPPPAPSIFTSLNNPPPHVAAAHQAPRSPVPHHAPPAPAAAPAPAPAPAPSYHTPDPYQQRSYAPRHQPPYQQHRHQHQHQHHQGHYQHQQYQQYGHQQPGPYQSAPRPQYKSHGAPISTSYYPQQHMYVTNHYAPPGPDPADEYPPADPYYPAAHDYNSAGYPPLPYDTDNSAPSAVAYQYQSAVAAVTQSSPPAAAAPPGLRLSPTSALALPSAASSHYSFGGLNVEAPLAEYDPSAPDYTALTSYEPYEPVEATTAALQALELNPNTSSTTSSASSSSAILPQTTAVPAPGSINSNAVSGVGYFNSPILCLQSPMSDLVRDEQLTFVNHLLQSPATTNTNYFNSDVVMAQAVTKNEQLANRATTSIRSLSNPFRNKLQLIGENSEEAMQTQQAQQSLSSELDSSANTTADTTADTTTAAVESQ